MDVFSRQKRSEIMSRVKSRGNAATEQRLIRFFKQYGVTGWRRRHSLFGQPDFVFPKLRVAVFVDGCFWHSCPQHCTWPTSNRLFWLAKLARNRARDRLVNRTLRNAGWRVLRIWQHELLRGNQARLARKIPRFINLARSPAQRCLRRTRVSPSP